MNNKKMVYIYIIIFCIFFVIGYFAINSIGLYKSNTINEEKESLKVKFLDLYEEKPVIVPENDMFLDVISDTFITFNVAEFKEAGESENVTIKVRNISKSLDAKVDLKLENDNPEYFKVTGNIESNELKAGDTTFAKFKIEMIKTPEDGLKPTTITARLIPSKIK